MHRLDGARRLRSTANSLRNLVPEPACAISSETASKNDALEKLSESNAIERFCGGSAGLPESGHGWAIPANFSSRRAGDGRARGAHGPDERPPAHSITSSARASSIGGTSKPSLGGLQVDNQLEFRRLHHRQVGWLGSL
jgi:hypothetical protein